MATRSVCYNCGIENTARASRRDGELSAALGRPIYVCKANSSCGNGVSEERDYLASLIGMSR